MVAVRVPALELELVAEQALAAALEQAQTLAPAPAATRRMQAVVLEPVGEQAQAQLRRRTQAQEMALALKQHAGLVPRQSRLAPQFN